MTKAHGIIASSVVNIICIFCVYTAKCFICRRSIFFPKEIFRPASRELRRVRRLRLHYVTNLSIILDINYLRYQLYWWTLNRVVELYWHRENSRKRNDCWCFKILAIFNVSGVLLIVSLARTSSISNDFQLVARK